MPTPFPGMDPYLEHPGLWPNVHASLIIALRDDLAPRLRPRYYVAVEERVVQLGADDLLFAARPDEIHQRFLQIRDLMGDHVVTVVELLSPANKRPGKGRQEYEEKRLELLGTRTHLVEIDLLREGQPMPMRGYPSTSDYRLIISRAPRRPRADLLPFTVRQPIPRLRLPLASGDDEPEGDLNELLHTLYDRAGYDLQLDYGREAEPPLTGDDATWANALLQAAGLR